MRVILTIILLASLRLFLLCYYRIPRSDSDEEVFESDEENSDVDEDLVPLDFVVLLNYCLL